MTSTTQTLQTSRPTNDNGAVSLGFSRHVIIVSGGSEFAALVRPDEDLDGTFICFDTDNQQWLRVYGWMMDSCEDAD